MTNINTRGATATNVQANNNIAVGRNPPPEMKAIAASEAAAGRSVGEMMMPAGQVDALEQMYHTQSRDAAVATVIGENASMHILRYSYGTHKGAEAWLADMPPRGEKLKMQIVCTPSWHVGGSDQAKADNAKKYGLTNEYVFEVRYPDGTKEQKKFKVGGQTPEYATQSPVIEIDVQKWAGQDIVMRGWPAATSPGGYIEARQTTLHL